MASSKPNYFPKLSPPDTFTLGVKASTYELGGTGHLNIQSVTLAERGRADTFSGTCLRKFCVLQCFIIRPWMLAGRGCGVGSSGLALWSRSSCTKTSCFTGRMFMSPK